DRGSGDLRAVGRQLPPQLAQRPALCRLYRGAGVRARAVALKMGQRRRLLAAGNMPPAINHDIDMRDMSWHRAIIEAFDTLVCKDADVMRVVGPAPMGGEFVEIVVDEAPLRRAMVDFSVRILILSLIISAVTATLVYLS